MKTELRPTPDTDAMSCRILHRELCDADFARKLERERDSAKTLNRTLLDQLEAKDAQIEAMRDAIEEVFNSFNDEPASDSAWLLDDRQTSALSKLQPFLP